MFLDIDRGRLTGGANDTDAISAFCDMPIDQFAQAGIVHLAIFVHGCDECHDAAGDLAE